MLAAIKIKATHIVDNFKNNNLIFSITIHLLRNNRLYAETTYAEFNYKRLSFFASFTDFKMTLILSKRPCLSYPLGTQDTVVWL
jgi:hypothetical protein